MSDLKLKAYVVVLSFVPAPITIQNVFAPSAHEATALAAVQFVQAHHLEVPLGACICCEMTPEWLRSALRVGEGGGGQVVSLVPQETPATGIPDTGLSGGWAPPDPGAA